VTPDGPAAKAGLRTGDVVTAIDGKAIIDGPDLSQTVRASGGKALAIDFTRDSQAMSLTVTPQRDPTGKVWMIKVMPEMNPEIVTLRSGPIGAVATGARLTWTNAVMQLKMIGKIVSGELSLSNITGPLTISDYAGQTARMGPSPFLTFIALVSISLGVMNLLPIPVLDGGLLLYYSLEVLTGRPLSERIGEYAQRVGVSLLLMLMALALFNDVVRRLA
jgi:regulator of sigma E protease